MNAHFKGFTKDQKNSFMHDLNELFKKHNVDITAISDECFIQRTGSMVTINQAVVTRREPIRKEVPPE